MHACVSAGKINLVWTLATDCMHAAIDHNGVYLGASAVVFEEITYPITLEAIAYREALALAADLSLQDIYVASDCQTVMQEIKDRSNAGYAAIIQEISAWSSSLYFCSYVLQF